MKLVKDFGKGITLSFGKGNFDEWAVILKHPSFPRMPTDEWYFKKITKYSLYSSPAEVYDDFVDIYDITTAEVTQFALDKISGIAKRYSNVIEADIVFTILYMGMIAEENKEGAILGKKIKRLGVYQTLIEGLGPTKAAHYSRGKGADYLLEVCKFRGF